MPVLRVELEKRRKGTGFLLPSSRSYLGSSCNPGWAGAEKGLGARKHRSSSGGRLNIVMPPAGKSSCDDGSETHTFLLS